MIIILKHLLKDVVGVVVATVVVSVKYGKKCNCVFTEKQKSFKFGTNI